MTNQDHSSSFKFARVRKPADSGNLDFKVKFPVPVLSGHFLETARTQNVLKSDQGKLNFVKFVKFRKNRVRTVCSSSIHEYS